MNKASHVPSSPEVSLSNAEERRQKKYISAIETPMALMWDTQPCWPLNLKEQHGHLVGCKCRRAIACIAGSNGGSLILSGRDSVFEYSRKPGQV